MSLFSQVASALCWVLYASFFEWYWHKLWMHHPRTPKQAFHNHTIIHHGLYKGDQSYFVERNQSPNHILLKPYALPLIFLIHQPIIWLIERYLAHNTAIGAMTAIVVYFVVYEYMHWNMHVPRSQFVERFRWFQFLRQHHHLHHRYMQKNFCVLFPLADWCLGTMITEATLARRRAEREQAIASGDYSPDQRKTRRHSERDKMPVKLSRFANLRLTRLGRMLSQARNLSKLKSHRSREVRPERKVRPMRDLFLSGKGRDDR